MKNKITKIVKEDLLTKMASEMVKNGLAAKYEKDDDAESGRLYVLIDNYGASSEQVAGQYFFEQELSEDGDTLYMTSLILVGDTLQEEVIPMVCVAMAIVNAKIPCGAFVLSADERTMAYKLVTPVSSSLSFDQLYDQLNILISNSVYASEAYVGLLEKFAEGNLSLNDIKASIE